VPVVAAFSLRPPVTGRSDRATARSVRVDTALTAVAVGEERRSELTLALNEARLAAVARALAMRIPAERPRADQPVQGRAEEGPASGYVDHVFELVQTGASLEPSDDEPGNDHDGDEELALEPGEELLAEITRLLLRDRNRLS
jgi:hypothetical protein